MRYAIFSDIHNHTAALQAVLRDAGERQVDGYFCLGDVGVDACVELVRQVDAPTVFGNWEVSGWPHLSPQNQAWTLQLPPVRKETGFWLTHASPLWPDHLATLADLQAKRQGLQMDRLFPYLHFESPVLWDIWGKLTEAKVSWLFHGHTHRQITWRFTDDNHVQKLTYSPLALRPGDTLVVGVGSVGRPEDGPGAAYIIFDDKRQEIEMVRVKATFT